MSGSDFDSSQPGALDIPIDFGSPWPAVRDDMQAYGQFIANLGLVFQHWMAIPYVIGDEEGGGIRQYDERNVESKHGLIYDNGYIYKYVGEVYGIFQGNTKDLKQLPAGYYADSVAYVSFNKFYKGSNKKASFAEFDKLIPCGNCHELWTVNFEKITHNPAGFDKLQYLASEIEFVMDNRGVIYNEGVDYMLENGGIQWLQSGDQPGISPVTQKGRIVAVRYKYKPYFYVKQMLHELRVHATFDENGEVKVQRGPTQCAVQVDWVFRDSLKEGAPDAKMVAEDTPNVGPR